jgi:hypothetical protein
MSETRDVVAEAVKAIRAGGPIYGVPEEMAAEMTDAGLLADPALTAEVERLWAQVARVEALHHADGDGDCTECGTDVYDEPIGWPCGTIRALSDPTEGGASE